MNWLGLIGKKIVAFRGYPGEKFGKPHTTLRFVLLDDKETFMELREQDPYDYHDCNDSARCIDIRKDAKAWRKMFDKDGFEEPDDLGCPF